MNNISIHLKGYYVHVSNHMVNKAKPNNIPFTPHQYQNVRCRKAALSVCYYQELLIREYYCQL